MYTNYITRDKSPAPSRSSRIYPVLRDYETCLIHTFAKCVTIHTYIYIYTVNTYQVQHTFIIQGHFRPSHKVERNSNAGALQVLVSAVEGLADGTIIILYNAY